MLRMKETKTTAGNWHRENTTSGRCVQGELQHVCQPTYNVAVYLTRPSVESVTLTEARQVDVAREELNAHNLQSDVECLCVRAVVVHKGCQGTEATSQRLANFREEMVNI